jgi:hypothetical protein
MIKRTAQMMKECRGRTGKGDEWVADWNRGAWSVMSGGADWNRWGMKMEGREGWQIGLDGSLV